MSNFKMNENKPINNSGKIVHPIISPAKIHIEDKTVYFSSSDGSFGKITVIRKDYDGFKEKIEEIEKEMEEIE